MTRRLLPPSRVRWFFVFVALAVTLAAPQTQALAQQEERWVDAWARALSGLEAMEKAVDLSLFDTRPAGARKPAAAADRNTPLRARR